MQPQTRTCTMSMLAVVRKHTDLVALAAIFAQQHKGSGRNASITEARGLRAARRRRLSRPRTLRLGRGSRAFRYLAISLIPWIALALAFASLCRGGAPQSLALPCKPDHHAAAEAFVAEVPWR